MLQAVTHVANSLGHLKTKYLKYLETLCAANGIDIQQLKVIIMLFDYRNLSEFWVTIRTTGDIFWWLSSISRLEVFQISTSAKNFWTEH